MSIYQRWTLSSREKQQLARALHACPCINDHTVRDVVLRQLPEYISNALTRSQRQDIDVENIIDTCLNYVGGTEHLIDSIDSHDKGTWQMRDLYNTLQAIWPQPVPWLDVAELKTILSQESLTDDVVSECWSSVPISSSIRFSKGEDALPGILDHLAKRRLSDGSAPLLVFLFHLAPYLSDPSVQESLNLWIQRIAHYLGIDVPAFDKHIVRYVPDPQPLQTATRHYLLVKIEPDLWREDSFLVKGWLFYDQRAEGLSSFEGQLSLPQISQQLERFIVEIHQRLGNKLTELTLEFLLPRALLCHEIDQWKVTVGKGMQFSIGGRYQTVVRSYERMHDADMRLTWHLWNAKWTNYQRSLRNADQTPLFFCSKQECEWQDALYARLIESQAVCLVLTLVPPEIPSASEWDILFTMLNAGTPIAIWLRKYTTSSTQILEEFKLDLSSKTIDHLPGLVLNRRRAAVIARDEAHPGRHLTLLWDDPGRMPPDVQYYYQAPE